MVISTSQLTPSEAALMVKIQIQNEKQKLSFNATGVLEMGRGPQREVPRFQVDDPFFSRDQLRIEEMPGGRIRLENLSSSQLIVLNGHQPIEIGAAHTLTLPLALTAGQTRIYLSASEAVSEPPAVASGALPAERAGSQTQEVSAEDAAAEKAEVYQSISPPLARPPVDGKRLPGTNAQLGPETLALWLETVLALQKTTAGTHDFYCQTAQAMVELIDLELGMVLLRKNDAWSVAGAYAANDRVNVQYSRTLLARVASERQTFFQDFNAEASASLNGAAQPPSQSVFAQKLKAAVVSPIFDVREEVVGALYGMRTSKAAALRDGIQPVEAQFVQLLASVIGSQLVRSAATRTRVQFEQFFSTELVRELERDPTLLEGRSQEITVLFSDLRGFTVLSQELGPQVTCRLVREMMETLTEHIVGHGGVIVDYAGDAILAMWNAPTPQPDHAFRACAAALDMVGAMTDMNERWRELAGGKLTLGIGINTGIAQVGNTGSTRKFQYGPLGHVVNLASRVQDATKRLGLPLLITDATRELLPGEMAVRRLGRVRLPGVQDPIVLHELHGRGAPLQWQAQRAAYEVALEQYERGEWAKACQSLLPLLQLLEQEGHRDWPTLKLMRRAGECLEARPDPFDPIIEMSTK
jgi:adenylate cyclase